MRSVVWTGVLALGMCWLTASVSAQQPAVPQAPQTQAAPAAPGNLDTGQARTERRKARRDQVRARLEKRVQARVDRLDRNHDGSVSRDEWSGAPKRFDRLDSNHDGVLTKDELMQRAAGRHRTRR